MRARMISAARSRSPVYRIYVYASWTNIGTTWRMRRSPESRTRCRAAVKPRHIVLEFLCAIDFLCYLYREICWTSCTSTKLFPYEKSDFCVSIQIIIILIFRNLLLFISKRCTKVTSKWKVLTLIVYAYRFTHLFFVVCTFSILRLHFFLKCDKLSCSFFRKSEKVQVNKANCCYFFLLIRGYTR